MRDTGIVRRVDSLGRIVVPIELRRTLGINVGDPIAIFADGERIVLEKHRDACAICGDLVDSMAAIHGRKVCQNCVTEIEQVSCHGHELK